MLPGPPREKADWGRLVSRILLLFLLLILLIILFLLDIFLLLPLLLVQGDYFTFLHRPDKVIGVATSISILKG